MHFHRSFSFLLPLAALFLAMPVQAQAPAPPAPDNAPQEGCLRNVGPLPQLSDMLQIPRGEITFFRPGYHDNDPTCRLPVTPEPTHDLESADTGNTSTSCRTRAYNNRAAARLAAGDANGAVADMLRALETAPHCLQCHINLGWALAGKGDYTNANAAFDHSIKLQPANAAAWTARARYFWHNTPQYERAFADLSAASATFAGNRNSLIAREQADILYERALLRLTSGYPRVSTRIIRASTRLCEDVPLISHHADLNAALGDLDSAIALGGNYHPRAYILRSLVRLGQGEIALARADLENAAPRSVQNRDAELNALVQSMLSWFPAPGDIRAFEHGDPAWRTCRDSDAEDRLAACTRIIDDAGQQPARMRARALVMRSHINIAQGEHGKTRADLNAAIEADPTYEPAYVLRFLLFMQQLEARAQSNAETSRARLGDISITPETELFFPDYDFLQSDTRLDDGLPDLDAAIRLDPHNSITRALRAVVLMRRGDIERARSDAERAFTLAPNNRAIQQIHNRLH